MVTLTGISSAQTGVVIQQDLDKYLATSRVPTELTEGVIKRAGGLDSLLSEEFLHSLRKEMIELFPRYSAILLALTSKGFRVEVEHEVRDYVQEKLLALKVNFTPITIQTLENLAREVTQAISSPNSFLQATKIDQNKLSLHWLT